MDDFYFRRKEEKTLRHLQALAKNVPSCIDAPILKTIYTRMSCTVEYSNVQVNKKSCKYCYFPWNEGMYKLKVVPCKIPRKRVRNILKKENVPYKNLSKVERKLLKKFRRNVGNKLVITCMICKKQEVTSMVKPKFAVQQKRDGEKLKRKKKDRYAGLKLYSSAPIKKEMLKRLPYVNSEKSEKSLQNESKARQIATVILNKSSLTSTKKVIKKTNSVQVSTREMKHNKKQQKGPKLLGKSKNQRFKTAPRDSILKKEKLKTLQKLLTAERTEQPNSASFKDFLVSLNLA